MASARNDSRTERFERNGERFARNAEQSERNAERFARNAERFARNAERFVRNGTERFGGVVARFRVCIKTVYIRANIERELHVCHSHQTYE